MTHPGHTRSTFGQHLLDTARAHGITAAEVADLLRLTVTRIRTLAGPADLDHHRLAAIRHLAQRLHLPWPAWLDPTDARLPEPEPAPAPPRDPVRLHAVLATLLGQPVPLDILAEVLDWPLARLVDAVDALATRIRYTAGFQLTRTPHAVTLAITPRLLDQPTRTRLAQIQRIAGVTDPTLYHLIYRIAAHDQERARALTRSARSALHEAHNTQLVSYDLEPDHIGEHYRQPDAINLRLTPDVAYSLWSDNPGPTTAADPIAPTDRQNPTEPQQDRTTDE